VIDECPRRGHENLIRPGPRRPAEHSVQPRLEIRRIDPAVDDVDPGPFDALADEHVTNVTRDGKDPIRAAPHARAAGRKIHPSSSDQNRRPADQAACEQRKLQRMAVMRMDGVPWLPEGASKSDQRAGVRRGAPAHGPDDDAHVGGCPGKARSASGDEFLVQAGISSKSCHERPHLILPATILPGGVDMQEAEGWFGHWRQPTRGQESVNGWRIRRLPLRSAIRLLRTMRNAPSSPDMDAAVPGFQAPAWLRGPHAQTVVGRAVRSTCRFRYARRRIDTPDGDFLDIDGALALVDGPLVLVLHGLEGSSRSGYVAQTCSRLVALGARPVALNFRSCSGEPNRHLRSYHSGETTDVATLVDLLRHENPGVPIGAIGYSLGGNVLLCYLEESGAGPLDAAVAVSVPFDLAASARRLESGMGRMYTRYFLRSIKDKIREKAARFPDAARSAPTALAATTMRGIDDAWTAPIHGYRNAAHYYETCSSMARLEGVRTPTLLIQADDDPFLPARALDEVREIGNPCLVHGFTRRGGHLGYLGARSSGRLWAEARATAWLVGRLAAGTGGQTA